MRPEHGDRQPCARAQRQNAGSKMAVVMPIMGKKARDWTAAADVIDAGGIIVKPVLQLALFTPSPPGRFDPGRRQGNLARTGFRNADVYMHRRGPDREPADDDVAALPR